MYPSHKIISIRHCQVYTAQCRIVPVQNRLCCSQCVIPLSWCQSVFDGWVMAEWLRRWLQQWAARGVSKILGTRFATGIHLMKQFAHDWYLLCFQCTEACYHVSFIQDIIDDIESRTNIYNTMVRWHGIINTHPGPPITSSKFFYSDLHSMRVYWSLKSLTGESFCHLWWPAPGDTVDQDRRRYPCRPQPVSQ